MWENLIFTGALQQLYLYIVYAVYNVALEGAVKQKKKQQQPWRGEDIRDFNRKLALHTESVEC